MIFWTVSSSVPCVIFGSVPGDLPDGISVDSNAVSSIISGGVPDDVPGGVSGGFPDGVSSSVPCGSVLHDFLADDISVVVFSYLSNSIYIFQSVIYSCCFRSE